jgi:hypothetical protein
MSREREKFKVPSTDNINIDIRQVLVIFIISICGALSP